MGVSHSPASLAAHQRAKNSITVVQITKVRRVTLHKSPRAQKLVAYNEELPQRAERVNEAGKVVQVRSKCQPPQVRLEGVQHVPAHEEETQHNQHEHDNEGNQISVCLSNVSHMKLSDNSPSKK